ncbi:thiocillin family RiPP [Rathayibacter toxicus]
MWSLAVSTVCDISPKDHLPLPRKGQLMTNNSPLDDELFSVDIDSPDMNELPHNSAFMSISSGGSCIGSSSCPISSAGSIGTLG